MPTAQYIGKMASALRAKAPQAGSSPNSTERATGTEGLTLIHCKIIGTQPLCYCKDLRLIDCEMLDTDLAFECSHVEATVTTPLISIKNPFSGFITAPNATLILDDPRARCRITLTQKN